MLQHVTVGDVIFFKRLRAPGLLECNLPELPSFSKRKKKKGVAKREVFELTLLLGNGRRAVTAKR